MDVYQLEGGRLEADRAAALAAARGEAELGQLDHALGQEDADRLQEQGAAQREMEQSHYDTAYQDFLNQQADPYNKINFEAGVLAGVPYENRQYYQEPSVAGQLAGLVIAGAGAAGT